VWASTGSVKARANAGARLNETWVSLNIHLHVIYSKLLDRIGGARYTKFMVTTMSERGQTAIPARIRKRFKLKAHQRLEWADDGKVIFVMPVARDPIAALRGAFPKGLTRALLASRREDARRNDAARRR